MTSSSFKYIQAYFSSFALFLLTLCFFVSSVSVSFTTITYLAAFFFLLLSGCWVTRWDVIRHNLGAVSFWILFALFVLGVTYTTSSMHLAWQDLHKRHWLLFTPFFVALIADEKWRVRMLNAFLVAVLVTLVISYLKVWTPINIYHFLPRSVRVLTGASVFEDHIVQSLAMSIAAFICGYRGLYENKWRTVYGICFLLLGFNVLFMSEGRTGYGIFILLSLYLALRRFGWKGFFSAFMIGLVAIVGAFFVSQSFNARITKIYQDVKSYHPEVQWSHKTPVGQRVEMLGIAKQMIKHRPWFGYGTGGIRTELPKIVPFKDRVGNPHIDYVENIYLNFLLQFGVFGLLVLAVVIAMQIKTSLKLPHKYQFLFHAILIAILFGGCFNSFFVSFSPAHLYALFSALALSTLGDKKLQSRAELGVQS